MTIIHADPDYLVHYGILGMKWGVRRYQNEDGTLTEAGLRRRQREVYKQTEARNRAKTAQTRAQAKIDAMNAKNAVRLQRQVMKEQQKQLKEVSKKAAEETKANEPQNSHGFTRSDLKSMSDKDLQAALNRAQNEKQLRQLLDEQRSPMRRALTNAGNTVLTTVVTGGALFATRSLLNRITDSNLGNVVMAAGGKNFMDFESNRSKVQDDDPPRPTASERRADRQEARTQRMKSEAERAKYAADRAEQQKREAKAKQDARNIRTGQNKLTNSTKKQSDKKNQKNDDDDKNPPHSGGSTPKALPPSPSNPRLPASSSSSSQSDRAYQAGRSAGYAVGQAIRRLGSGRSSSTLQLPAHTSSNSGSSGSGLRLFGGSSGKHTASQVRTAQRTYNDRAQANVNEISNLAQSQRDDIERMLRNL